MVQQGISPTVRIEEMITSGEKRRYWDPTTGRWTPPLAGNASAERFYTRTKSFLLQPPGELAIYVNNDRLESKNPDPRQRERDKQNAFTGPYPIGEKKTICRCSELVDKNCDTWEEHYGQLGLFVHHMVKDEMSDRAISMTEDDISAVVDRLASQGYKLVKEDDGNNDNSQKKQEREWV